MVAIAYNKTSDHHLAQDAAQQALTKALTSLTSLKVPEKFGPWLLAITRNTAKSIASQKTFQSADLTQIPDNKALTNENQLVKQAIASLKPIAREIIIMRFYNNCSYAHITAATGLSTPAINGQLKRAKQKIAKYLKTQGFTEDLT